MTPNALIFDIETIADVNAGNREAIGAFAKHRRMTPEEYGGLCPPLARVVCIAWFDAAAAKLAAVFDMTLGAVAHPRELTLSSGDPMQRDPMTCALEGCDGEAQL